MATTAKPSQYSYSDFLSILEKQPQLYELHTHLLGMGNSGFWIDTILCDWKILPTNDMFREKKTFREVLCPLIWESDQGGFVKAKKSTEFIEYLRESDSIPWETKQESILVKQDMETKFDENLLSIFWNLIQDDKFHKELHHRGMKFEKHFSYDVVLVLSDLAKALSIDVHNGDDIAQMKIAEKLGIYLSEDTKTIKFRHWIIFNARKQCFEIVYGIQVEDLRKLITVDATSPNEAKKNARAHIINAFSMCDAQGTPARHIDFHNFRGCFTPEFYPRRFALKDSIYSQRLDVLAALIYHVFKRYQTCLPPVKYCEFSVGVGDLSSPWVFDVLRSFPVNRIMTVPDKQLPIYKATEEYNSFSQVVRDGCYPYLEVAFKRFTDKDNVVPSTPNVIYKFLAGFDRTNVQSPLCKTQNEALRLLNDSPHIAILLMRKEIWNSENPTEQDKRSGYIDELFQDKAKDSRETNLQKLEKLKKEANKIPWFYDWVVGIDLFGDELGYPYCLFVTRPFITYVQDIRNAEENGQPTMTRKKYPHFGVRVHCGENVQYADADAPSYRSFIAHMYIVFCCLRYLRYKLNYGIRIGHGIGFERILGESMSSSQYRKSSILRAEMRHQAQKLFENIAFEVNITSNEYLLGDSLRLGNIAQTHCLNALLKLKAPIVLSTDDDGIWPIDCCSVVHPGHHSLTAEYCRAMSSSLFTTPKHLEKIFENSKNFCFFDMKGDLPKKPYEPPMNDFQINTVILHPDLVEHILCRLSNAGIEGEFWKKYRLSYTSIDNSSRMNNEELWINEYQPIAQVAYIYLYIEKKKKLKELKDSEEYRYLFGNNQKETLEYIWNQCNDIHNEFMIFQEVNSLRRYRYINIKAPETMIKTTLLSLGPHHIKRSYSDASPEINYIAGLNDEKKNIYIYIDRVDINAKKEVWEQISNETGLKDLCVTYYTNRDKNKFSYIKSGTTFELSVNPKSDRRNENEKNYLYAICEHAGAATAAFHLIAKCIASDSQNSTDTYLYSVPVQPSEQSQSSEQSQLTSENLLKIHVNDVIFSDASDDAKSALPSSVN